MKNKISIADEISWKLEETPEWKATAIYIWNILNNKLI